VPVWAVDANASFARPGPRLVDGIESLAAILHPEVFGPETLGAARRVDVTDSNCSSAAVGINAPLECE